MSPSARLRELLLAGGAVSALVISLAQFALGQLWPGRAAWQLGAAATLVALVIVGREGNAGLRRWAPVAAAMGFCLVNPAMMIVVDKPSSLLALVSVPLITSILFFDEVRVVLAATVSGSVAVLVSAPLLALSGGEAAEFVLSNAMVNALAALCAYGYGRQRAIEVKQQAERNEGLQLAQQRQAQAERLALVGQLASGVAHEINNPLAFVSSNVGLVREHLEGREVLHGEPPAEVLAEAQEGLERIRQIVADLKAFARDDVDGSKSVHLADVVQEAVRLASVSMPAGVFIECSGLSTVPLVKASHRKLVQVVLHLLVNAADALREAKVKDPRVTVTVRMTSAGVAIDVADNGPGVPVEVRGRLFEPFLTTKPPGKGTGLGLAMARETLRALGGELSLNPSLHGACFSAEIPVERRPVDVEQGSSKPPS